MQREAVQVQDFWDLHPQGLALWLLSWLWGRIWRARVMRKWRLSDELLQGKRILLLLVSWTLNHEPCLTTKSTKMVELKLTIQTKFWTIWNQNLIDLTVMSVPNCLMSEPCALKQNNFCYYYDQLKQNRYYVFDKELAQKSIFLCKYSHGYIQRHEKLHYC